MSRWGKHRAARTARVTPVIGHEELLARARTDLQREMNALRQCASEEGLPEDCYADERRALKAKIDAVNTMLFYERGEY